MMHDGGGGGGGEVRGEQTRHIHISQSNRKQTKTRAKTTTTTTTTNKQTNKQTDNQSIKPTKPNKETKKKSALFFCCFTSRSSQKSWKPQVEEVAAPVPSSFVGVVVYGCTHSEHAHKINLPRPQTQTQ